MGDARREEDRGLEAVIRERERGERVGERESLRGKKMCQ